MPVSEPKYLESKKVALIFLSGPFSIVGHKPDIYTFTQKVEEIVNSGYMFLVVDIGQVSGIGSTAHGTLFSAARKMREAGGDLRFARVSLGVKEYLSHFPEEEIKAYTSVERAIESFETDLPKAPLPAS